MQRPRFQWLLGSVLGLLAAGGGIRAEDVADGTPDGRLRDPSAAAVDASPSTEEQADRGSLIPFPFVFYTPETKTGGGVLVSYLFTAGTDGLRTRTSSITPIVIYTQRKQYSATLAGELYLSRDRYWLSGVVSFADFPNTFWGVGNDSPDGAEEDYTPRFVIMTVEPQRWLGGGWYAGLTATFLHRELRKTEAGGILDAGDAPGVDDGSVVGAGLVVTRDTRDGNVYPRSGGLDRVSVTTHDGAMGSDYDFSDVTINLRRYVRTSTSGVLAFQVVGRATAGTRPFDLLPAIGGQALLRGYYEGRYRDRDMMAGQIEYRTHLWRRLGGVAFAAAGQVAPDEGAFRLDGFRAAAGFGLRFLLSRKEGLNLRADFGFGENSSGFYLGGGEAF